METLFGDKSEMLTRLPHSLSDANEECCQGCQFAPSTKVCRSSNGPCDPEEKCTGKDSSCPVDVIASNGMLHNLLFCASDSSDLQLPFLVVINV